MNHPTTYPKVADIKNPMAIEINTEPATMRNANTFQNVMLTMSSPIVLPAPITDSNIFAHSCHIIMFNIKNKPIEIKEPRIGMLYSLNFLRLFSTPVTDCLTVVILFFPLKFVTHI